MTDGSMHETEGAGAVKVQDVTSSATMTTLLLRVAAHRDREAYRRLYAHFAPRIKSYLMGLGAEPAQAEEVAQEAMTSVWRKAGSYDAAKAAAATWIFTIARNLRIDALRRDKRPALDVHEPMLHREPEPTSDRLVELEQEQHLIREALTRLPPDQALVVRMSFYEDKSHGTIAEELNLPLGTVKSRLRLAFRRLRAAVGEELA